MAAYSEGLESIKGASISRSISFGGWSTDLTAFTGNYSLKTEVTTEEGLVAVVQDHEHTYGGQFIVNTPIAGVRTGASYYQSKQIDGDTDLALWTLSADATFDRYFARAEYTGGGSSTYDYGGYYAQTGVRVWKGLWANVQMERSTGKITIPAMDMVLKVDAIEDYALGLAYKLSPQLVLKGEYHDFEGYQVGVPVNPFGPPVTNDYFIISVAAAF